MRNLLEFIINHSHLLLFLLLEVVAFLLITSRQSYPQSTMLTASNRVVASTNQTADDIASYFHLRKDNEDLNAEIGRLRQQVQDLQNQLEPITEHQNDSAAIYQYAHLRYRTIPAKVIDLTTNHQQNYLTLNKGALDGIAEGMGVISDKGIVGIVGRVNDRFALVVPIIHTATHLSARILKNGHLGFTNWKGHDSHHVDLMEVGRHISVSLGDSIVTSGLTPTFPEGLLIGVVDKVRLEEGDNYYTIRVNLSTDFHQLRYVQVLSNPSAASMRQLVDSVSVKNE